MKKILYVDMDNVLVDFSSGIDKLDEATKRDYKDRFDDVHGILYPSGQNRVPGSCEHQF